MTESLLFDHPSCVYQKILVNMALCVNFGTLLVPAFEKPQDQNNRLSTYMSQCDESFI